MQDISTSRYILCSPKSTHCVLLFARYSRTIFFRICHFFNAIQQAEEQPLRTKFSHHQQRRVNFNTLNPSLSTVFPLPPSFWWSTDTIPLPQVPLIFSTLVPDRNRHHLILIQHLPSLPLNFLGFIGLFCRTDLSQRQQ